MIFKPFSALISLAFASSLLVLNLPSAHASIQDVAYNACTRGLLIAVYGTENGYASVTYATPVQSGQVGYVWSYERADGSWIDFYFVEFSTPIPSGMRGELVVQYPGGASAARDFTVDDDCRNVSQSQIQGTSYEDRNQNGMRDHDEPILPDAYFKLTDGGNWYKCGSTAHDGDFRVSIKPGSYYIFPIAPPGYRPVALRILTDVPFGGSTFDADMGFVKDASAPLETCDLYNPPRGGDMPVVVVGSGQ